MRNEYRPTAARRSGTAVAVPKGRPQPLSLQSRVGRATRTVALFGLVAIVPAAALSGGLPPLFAAAQQAMTELADRSLGPRLDARLSKGKGAPADRVARALPRVIDRNARSAARPGAAAPGAFVAPGAVAPDAPFVGTSGASVPGGVFVAPGGVAGGPAGVAFLPPFGGGGPGIGGGGGGGVIIVPPGVGPVVPGPGGTAPVPEPASWTMMIAGFAMIGGLLRSRARHAQRAA